MSNLKTIAFLPVNRRGADLNGSLMAGLEAEFFGRVAEQIHATILRREAVNADVDITPYRYYADIRSLAMRLNPLVENGGLAFHLPAFATLKKLGRLRAYLRITKQLGRPQIVWSCRDRLIKHQVDLANLQPIPFAEEKNGYTFYHHLFEDTDFLVHFDCGEEKLLARVKFRWARTAINVHLELISKGRDELKRLGTVIGPIPVEPPRRLQEMCEYNRRLEEKDWRILPVA